jgi:hypothetical protein
MSTVGRHLLPNALEGKLIHTTAGGIMALADSYVQTYGQLGEVFKRMSEGQAPDKFTRQHLKDLGFTSANFHAVIPLLKALGFLAADGSPTARYHAYRDHSQSRAVLGEALREAYGDLFTIKANPTNADRQLIEGKFKSAHNTSERVAQLMASTFFALLALADLHAHQTKRAPEPKEETKQEVIAPTQREASVSTHRPTLHYNIQIHLPATKDVEVFNAIFKSLREHLLD